LDLNPIIVYDLSFETLESSVIHFKKEFEVVGYNFFDDIKKLVDKRNIDYFYAIKYGTLDNLILDNCKNFIHSVFCSDVSQIHGDRYAVISEWMSKKSNYKIPFVPHMINLPSYEEDFREVLRIPNTHTVIGRYGSIETFNISFVNDIILKILEARDDIWFLFLNTERNIFHERCLYFDTITDLKEKVKFINTCDAMLHARDYGETFGLSVLEFASKNKQIISYDNEELQNNHPLGGRNHFLYLKDNCFKYQDKEDLQDILLNINRNNPFDTDYLNQEFSPQSVINKFEEVFIK
jgi:glycosyltransferase involved in cell wall biosynthesis